ncbi:MAG: CBS domain-containing protein [Methanophagales archaeon]|nr:CBS domain-containing protein [Methanophagales archaeon]
MAATEEESATIMFATLEGTKVRSVMRTENVSVLADMPITELAEKMLKEKNAEYAVVSDRGDLKGLITFSEIKELSTEQRHSLRTSDIISPVDRLSAVISQEEEAIEALKRMIRAKKNILAVEEEEGGEIIGVITKRDIVMHLEILKGGS